MSINYENKYWFPFSANKHSWDKGGCHTKLKHNGFIERIELYIFSLLTYFEKSWIFDTIFVLFLNLCMFNSARLWLHFLPLWNMPFRSFRNYEIWKICLNTFRVIVMLQNLREHWNKRGISENLIKRNC